ncbi:hypothetical protein LTR10_013426 [Elasticomyces elasticus]|uniref:Pentatricopeptide repeat protein n=1 Tax=Exophiala sideris TaxID=1016849 RepID=A0ABR0J4H2_9EURO|nr:hypothetical protein LTR10_013426 [Elasticomyces elasticus]KAK5027344.1 hypothetical protein LTS07_006946 [Exophiala sideris]KAK5034954.1 hypothetical protein LTR13_006136 [Exophiala sideris]KAK5056312.1 hypothetical protein LTR69_007853 [Exophiala sideris]KAK5181199.1 hypothetical protein LTR44_006530 [Eurotiomycetes sp. CCFEE 6388]
MFGELLCALSRCQRFSRTRYHPGRIFSRPSSGYPRPFLETDNVDSKPTSSTQRLPPTPFRRKELIKKVRLLESVDADKTTRAFKEHPSEPTAAVGEQPAKPIEAVAEKPFQRRVPLKTNVASFNPCIERSPEFDAIDGHQRNSCHEPFPDTDEIGLTPIRSVQSLPSHPKLIKRVRLLELVDADNSTEAVEEQPSQPGLPVDTGAVASSPRTEQSRDFNASDSHQLIPVQLWGAGPVVTVRSCAGVPRVRKETRSRYVTFPERWIKLHKKLIFPEDGDLVRARERGKIHRQRAMSFVSSHDVETLRAAWKDMAVAERSKLLPSILAGCLAISARKTLMMLTVLKGNPREWRTRCECLCYLDLIHSVEVHGDSDLQALFARQIKLVSTVTAWPKKFSMPRAFLVLLLRHNDVQKCDNIIDTVFEAYDEVPVRLILVMADHFTRKGDPDRAIDVLWRIPQRRREYHRREILDRFRNLIRLDTIEEAGAVRNFRVLPRLTEFELPMDERIHNAIIDRAITLGRPNVAWELYRYMEVENINVDARSHLVLLRDSFDRNDHERLDKIMSAIHQREDLYKNPYLVAYMMHIIRVVCCIDRKLLPESSFSHILAIYDRAYDRSPLIKLGLVDALLDEASSQRELPEPPPAILGFTIWAYVLCQQKEGPVWKLWHWIVHMIKQHDVSICKAAEHDVLYNGFIHFFSRDPTTIDRALVVVQEMIELQLCPPTKRTWSEVLCGFLQYGDDETAEKIWRGMLTNEMRSGKEGWEYLLTKFDKSRVALEISDILDERRMPEDIAASLGDDAEDPITEDATQEVQQMGGG